MKRPTIKDVALAANVSVTTVSDALNGKGRLSEATRLRVVQVAQKLNFRPSSTAKSLNAGRAGVLLLGIVRNEDYTSYGWDSEFFLQVLGGASDYAMSRGYVVAYLPFAVGSPLPEIVCDGMIVIDPMHDDPLVAYAHSLNLPLITLGRIVDEPESPYVDNDLPLAVGLALGHLGESGSLTPLLVYYSRPASYVQDVLDAFQEWCRREGVEGHTLPIESNLSMDQTIARIEGFLSSNGATVNGVVTAYDSLALASESAFERLKLRVPEQMRLISVFDSSRLDGRATPISAVDLKPREVGLELAKNLIFAVEGSELQSLRTLVNGVLIERSSTGT